MSIEPSELPGEESERSWGERIAGVASTWQTLAHTRLEILREELSEKRSFALKGMIAIAIAAVLSAGALLLLAALLAAVLAHAFGNVALGILAALILFVAGAGAAVAMGWKSLTRVRPFQFPAARHELSRDWEAVRASWSQDGEPDDGGGPEEGPDGPKARSRGETLENLEERFRAGAE
jgi:uncharacterized membrane protein YqjE